MRVLISGFISTMLFLPALSNAQSSSLSDLLGSDGQQYCAQHWNGADSTDQRRYSACLLEQRQARSRIQTIHRRYASRQFYRGIALPFCRASQNAEGALNLVDLSFCLEDEVTGYLAIQDLRRRYGGNRIDNEADQAITESGSWASAAAHLKRSTSLKTVRRGTSP
jgi:hypothetical protein